MLVVALLLAASTPFDEAMTKAVGYYNDAEWDASLKELTLAERYAADDAQRVTVWLHQGVVLANIPDLEGAKAAWARALTLQPDAKLPLKVSTRVAQEFEAAHQAAGELRRYAPAPTPAETPPEAATAEGGRRLPIVSIVTLGLSVISAAVGIGFGAGSLMKVGAARAAVFQDDKVHLHDDAQSFAIVANTSYGVAGVFALWALVSFLVAD
jgi:hypothetical protein